MTERLASPMASICLPGRSCGAMVGAAILVGVVIGCGPGATAPQASPASPVPSVATAAASPTVAGRDAPPDALLAAEGGDPVAGQLGTYLWFETGSDSPWLPGAPLTVGAGEPLTADLQPDGDIATWAARYSPAATTRPDVAASLADGTGSPAFAAPGRGTWTVELFVEFAAGAGNAHYFWRLQVE